MRGARHLRARARRRQAAVPGARPRTPGHVLFTGIADAERARGAWPRRCSSTACFSGWGIRTLAAGEARYNPMSYHNGSVWPHDNALIAAGLARYGSAELRRRGSSPALFEASAHFDLHRLPELFCGFRARGPIGPALYPVACSPQAWAAAAPSPCCRPALGSTSILSSEWSISYARGFHHGLIASRFVILGGGRDGDGVCA